MYPSVPLGIINIGTLCMIASDTEFMPTCVINILVCSKTKIYGKKCFKIILSSIFAYSFFNFSKNSEDNFIKINKSLYFSIKLLNASKNLEKVSSKDNPEPSEKYMILLYYFNFKANSSS